MNNKEQTITSDWITTKEGNPAGGKTTGRGIEIEWQNGPVENQTPNGASIEDIINVAIERLLFFQYSKFKNPFNRDTIGALRAALLCLEVRTKKRENAGVEGTYEVEGAPQGHHKGCCKG